MTPRSIDHLVLPTADLGVARDRLDALGFTVAPEGLHPFGTKNACVYLADDTFLEPLAVEDEPLADAAVAAGNVFVARDRVFRAQRGEEGLSAIVMASDDADADHEAFLAAGVSAGRRLDFSRAYVDAAGETRTVSFRLAFAAPATVTDTFFFTCERVDAPAGGRGALAVHRNGVTALAGVVASARNPRSLDDFLAVLAARHTETSDGAVSVDTGNAGISVLTPARLASRFQVTLPPDADLCLCGVVFAVADLAETTAVFESGGTVHHRIGDTVVVPAAPGQGAFFAFRESAS